MVFERPKRPNGGRPSPATQRPNSPTQRPTQRPGNRPSSGSGGNGGRNGRGGGNGRGNNNNSDGQPFPSPWLIEPPVAPDESASFIEYLRWMRAYDSDDPYRDPKKVEILPGLFHSKERFE